MSGAKKPMAATMALNRTVPPEPLPTSAPSALPPKNPPPASSPLAARNPLGESVRPMPAPSSFSVIESTDERGLTRRTSRASDVFAGSNARSRKLVGP
jgi:hypothetical protein